MICNIGYPSETRLKLKSREVLFAHNIHSRYSIVLQFCAAVSQPCSVQNFKTIGKFMNKLWVNESLRDLGWRRVSHSYAILANIPMSPFSVYGWTMSQPTREEATYVTSIIINFYWPWPYSAIHKKRVLEGFIWYERLWNQSTRVKR